MFHASRFRLTFAALWCSLLIAATSQAAPPPPADQILKTLRPQHPRLLADAATFETLKRRIEKSEQPYADWSARIHKIADGMLAKPPSQYKIPDGIRLLRVSRQVLDRTDHLAMAYRLTGEAKYKDRLWRELASAAAFKDWNPSHFLDTAEMTHAFAIAYDWLYHDWSPTQRQTIRQAIIDKGLKPAMACYQGTYKPNWWIKGTNNWNQVCNGGVGIGALAIADEHPKFAGELLHHALAGLPTAMREFAPDGACVEGPSYWHYAIRYNVYFLAAMQSALGTDFGYSDLEGFSHVGDFPVHMTGPNGRTFNFGDGGDRVNVGAEMYWLAKRFNRPIYAVFYNQWVRGGPRDLLWRDPSLAHLESPDEPTARHFRYAEIVSLRSSWDDPDALFVAMHAGDNQASHGHLDVGSFVFDALGERWAVDLGGENYNLPKYWDYSQNGRRWTYYRMRAEANNTLVLNPNASEDQNPLAKTVITRLIDQPGRRFAIADLTKAYPDADLVQRGVRLLDEKHLVVCDLIRAKKPSEIHWFMNTQASIELSEDQQTAVLKIGDKQLRAQLTSPNSAKFIVLDAKPLPASPNPVGQKINKNIRRLAIHLAKTKTTVITVVFTPATDDTPDAPTVAPLMRW